MASSLCCCLIFPLSTNVAQAAPAIEIGVTAAVRPNVHGTPPDQETRILTVGTDLYADESVITSKQGQTHLLFVDGSTLSMGPGSEVTLDHFVYDPDRKAGELVVSASKGLLRFVGGRISKTRPVLIKTPSSVIGIRGGIALIQVGDADTPAAVTMLYGQEAFMERNGQRQTVTRPGYRIVETQDGGIEEPKPATQEELTQELQTLEDPPPADEEQSLGEIAPASGGDTVRDEDVAETQMAELGSDNDPQVENAANGIQDSAETTSTEATTESTMAQQQSATEAQKPVSATMDVDPSDNRVNESAADFTAIGIRAEATDLNATDTITFSLTDNAGGRFAIDPRTGVIHVANSALLDAETSRSHSVTVRATSSDGSFTIATFIITIEDDNSEFAASIPADSNATANLANESAANGTAVGVTATGTDNDVSDAVTYSLDDSAGGRFTIDPSTGVIRVADNALLDAEAAQNHSVTVRTISADGSSNTATFTIAIGDDRTEFAVTTPTDSVATANSVTHAAAGGSATELTAFASDSDISDAGGITYSLFDDAGGRFQIGPSSGVVTTTTAATDFKSNRRYTVTARAASPDGTTADASFSIEILYDNFQGRLKRGTSALSTGTDDADSNNNSTLSDVSLGFGKLGANIIGGAQSLSLPFPDSAGAFSFTTADNWPFGSLAGTSNGFLNSEQTFVYYEIADGISARSLVFAGDPATAYPGSGVTAFNLTADFVRDQDVPFLSGFPIPSLTKHGTVYIAWDDSSPNSQRPLGGGLVYIYDNGTNQKSRAIVIAGRVLDDPSATQHASATLFGLSQSASTAQPAIYSGGLASSDAGDLSDFFGGGPDAFVLESATVNTSDVVQSIGISRSFEGGTNTFNSNSVALRDTTASFTAPRTTHTLTGFATGNQQVINGSGTVTFGRVYAENNDPASIAIVADAALNTIGFTFNLNDFDERTIVYEFGSAATADGTGAFIENGRYAATGTGATVNGISVTSMQGLVTSDVAVFDTDLIPTNFDLCDCDYLTWGFWGATREFVSGSPNTAITHLGTWVAGDASGIDLTGSIVVGAVYSGNVIGNVQNGGPGGSRYLASGTIDLTFNFSPGSYTLEDVTVSNFDGATYTSTSGSGSSFTQNRYDSDNAGLTIASGSRTLALQGAFFSPQASPALPLATAGQAQIADGGFGYFASLVYGATLQP